MYSASGRTWESNALGVVGRAAVAVKLNMSQVGPVAVERLQGLECGGPVAGKTEVWGVQVDRDAGSRARRPRGPAQP